MTESGYYVGEDLKFEVNLTATGFDMNRDNYKIDLYCGNKTLHFTKSDIKVHGDKFYLPVPTATLAPGGLMRMVVTSYVPDSDFPDGTRTEITIINLPSLKTVL